ncbi:signal peptidase II [Lusitaniella coriacea LEGE 07167]|nr:signal peptidase II [Lusitaniella coriacea]
MKNPWFWTLALIGLILDRTSKSWAADHFTAQGDTIPLLPNIFHLTYALNTGAAFSLFSGGVDWLRWLSIGVSLALIVFALVKRLLLIEQLGYGLVFAGAAGNGFCRFAYGHVVDFLDFRWINFPVFNLADVFICIGIILLLGDSFRPSRSLHDPQS